MKKLLQIMEMLRDESHGCSWDRQQTFQSIAQHTLEEVYEVIEAIETEDYSHLPNELGDLLFQIVFYSQMGKEAGLFTFDDVVQEIESKLLRRHPHVFPEASISNFGQQSKLSPKAVELAWEKIKVEERRQASSLQGNGSTINSSINSTVNSALNDVPLALPGMMRAKKLQNRARNVGFDWKQLSDVFAKVSEELDELNDAIEQNDQDQVNEEFGDLLFSMVNLSRHLQIDPETSLRAANKKFENRFRMMEALSKKENLGLEELSQVELERYWDKVKSLEKADKERNKG